MTIISVPGPRDPCKPSEWLNESREAASLAELEKLAPDALEKLCEAWTLV
jgi:hypothetical protein